MEQTELGHTSRYHHIVTVVVEALEEEASLDDAVVRRVTHAGGRRHQLRDRGGARGRRRQHVHALAASLRVRGSRVGATGVYGQSWSDTIELRAATLTREARLGYSSNC